MNRVAHLVRHSSAWETIMTRSDSISTERKISESGFGSETSRNSGMVSFDFDIEPPSESSRRKEHLLNTLKREVMTFN
ncbi:unnamed protein product [Onchocerca flexuosa]|uniref:Uncharacterized protein n=1 Tax=Onchocerca flexuosa TaxID=387005 RepID=A0A183HR74_9BILA|nr:unnamed protein product [Onchocerca flexuosa]